MAGKKKKYHFDHIEDARNKNTMEKIMEFITQTSPDRSEEYGTDTNTRKIKLSDFFQRVKDQSETYSLAQFQMRVTKEISKQDTDCSFITRRKQNPKWTEDESKTQKKKRRGERPLKEPRKNDFFNMVK